MGILLIKLLDIKRKKKDEKRWIICKKYLSLHI